MKIFFLFSPARLTNMPKWSLWSYYIADLSRKLQKSHSMTLKMDPFQESFLYIVTCYSTLNMYQRRDLPPPRTRWWKISRPSTKRGKYRVDGGGYFVGKWRSWSEMGKCSKIEKTVKFQKYHMKFFFPSPRPLSTLTPKYSLYLYYIAGLSKKPQKSHSDTLEMDQ